MSAIDLYLLSIIGLMRIGSRLRNPALRSFMVKSVARAAYHAGSKKRRRSEENLSQAFGGKLSRDEVRRVVKGSFYHFWSEAFSIAQPAAGDNVRVEIRGMEHLQRAKTVGKGAILWESGYFGRRFLMKRILYRYGFRIHQVYGENHAGGFYTPCPASWLRQNVITRFFDACEESYVEEVLALPLWAPLPVVRVLFERLKGNAIICAAGDGTLGWNPIRKRFLGGYRVFHTGMVSLARSSGASILPVFCVQESDDTVALIIEPPISVDADMERATAAEIFVQRYARLLEGYIRRFPSQYCNWHFSLDAPMPETETGGAMS